MDLQPSILKLRFDPAGLDLRLLEVGWTLDGPIKFPQKNGTDVVPTPDSPFPLILSTLNSEFILKFTVADDSAATRKDSMIDVLNSLIAIAALGVKPLWITVQGLTTNKWIVEQCRVSENEPWHQPTGDGKVWTMKTYTLTCAGISYD